MYEHIKRALERQQANGWAGLSPEPEAKSHIISGKHPNSGLYYEQRVAGTATECAAFAMSNGLAGEGFRISKDIYG